MADYKKVESDIKEKLVAINRITKVVTKKKIETKTVSK